MVAILPKCPQTLPSFPKITSVTGATFCLHALPLEREKTRVTIKMPDPVIQPYVSSTEVVSSFFYLQGIFIMLCFTLLVFLSCHTAAMRREENFMK